MTKLTVLFGHPINPGEFERYYANVHLPIAANMTGVVRLELTKFSSNADGTSPVYYRMAELYFSSPAELATTLGSAAGQAAANDIPNFATGGATMLVGSTNS